MALVASAINSYLSTSDTDPVANVVSGNGSRWVICRRHGRRCVCTKGLVLLPSARSAPERLASDRRGEVKLVVLVETRVKGISYRICQQVCG